MDFKLTEALDSIDSYATTLNKEVWYQGASPKAKGSKSEGQKKKSRKVKNRQG